ncbi:MAG: hypothetical protein NT068_00735 [Candidatus Nomurabacteria bacterium]|nr:hypothetical protein [Candidatus Nomurabacteria bacterium]
MQTIEKIPESLDLYFKEKLGFSLTTLLEKKEFQKLKNRLKATIVLVPESHHSVNAPVCLEKDILIKITGPGEYGFQPIGNSNTIAFQLEYVSFKQVNFGINIESHFETRIEDLVKALQ